MKTETCSEAMKAALESTKNKQLRLSLEALGILVNYHEPVLGRSQYGTNAVRVVAFLERKLQAHLTWSPDLAEWAVPEHGVRPVN